MNKTSNLSQSTTLPLGLTTARATATAKVLTWLRTSTAQNARCDNAMFTAQTSQRPSGKPITAAMACAWRTALLGTLLCVTAPSTQAQDTSAGSNSKRAVDMPGLLSENASGRGNEVLDPATRNRSGSGRMGGSGGSLSMAEKPGATPQLQLTTSVETKVENKTTNNFSGKPPVESGAESASPSAEALVQMANGNTGLIKSFEFAQFVSQSTGKTLKVFGADLMREGGRLGQADAITVPATYRVGPGDELLIRAWGQIDLDVQIQVDRSGQIFLPKVGQAMVAGIAVGELAPHLRKVIGRQYKDFELTATMGSLRNVQFYTSGFASQPGLHTVSSAATVLHALMSAGGPGPNADPRRVVVRRSGAAPLGMDLYEMLVDGNRGNDAQILPGDVIHFEPSRGLAAVAGQVNREAIFHVRAGNSVGDLLRYAGGLTTTADAAQVRIERLDSGRRVIETIALNEEGLNRPVRAGDVLMVLPVSQRIDNAVTLRGNVAVPLRTQWREGMRVSDLIPDARALVRPAALAQRNERNTLDKMLDAARDIDISRDYPEVNWDYATIERLNATTQTLSVLTFDLGRVLFQKDATQNLALQAGDNVIVYARKDFEQPESKKMRLVRIEGEVARPGVYAMNVGDTLGSVIQRAGGASAQAYVFGTRFTRVSARKQEEQRIKQATDRVEQDYFRRLATRSQNVVAQEDAMMSGAESEAVRTLVSKLRNYRPEGRVTLDLKGADTRIEDLPAVSLEDGDTIQIPARPSTVTMSGSVFQEGSILWRQGSDVTQYIDKAGGTRNHADRDGVVVLRADGSVRTARLSGWMGAGLGSGGEVNPGDTIFVPEDVERVSKTRTLKDWTSILYQFGIGATALKVLGAL